MVIVIISTSDEAYPHPNKPEFQVIPLYGNISEQVTVVVVAAAAAIAAVVVAFGVVAVGAVAVVFVEVYTRMRAVLRQW